jgi:hypothetical protein
MMDFGKVTFEGKEYRLTSAAEFEYRSHANGWQLQHPDNYVSAHAVDAEGNKYKVWWFVPDTSVELDSIDYSNVDDVEEE